MNDALRRPGYERDIAMIREFLEFILRSEKTSTFGIVILSAAITAFARIASRNDRFKTSIKNDLGFGLDLCVTAVVLVITRSAERLTSLYKMAIADSQVLLLDKETAIAMWKALLVVMILWGVSIMIRKLGWRDDNSPTVFWGIVMPNLIGIYLLGEVIINP